MPGKGSGCTSLSSLTIDDDISAEVSEKYLILIILNNNH